MPSLATMLSAARQGLRAEGSPYPDDDPKFLLYSELLTHKSQTDPDAAVRSAMYRHFDSLYYPPSMTEGGADHWPVAEREKYDGQVHVSVNIFPAYVDIPSDIQAITPYVNAKPDSSDKKDMEAADRREKLFWALWDSVNMDLKLRIIARGRGLYGVTAIKPYWNPVTNLPALRVIETPENLRIGWGDGDFSRKDWALYNYTLSPQAVQEDFDVNVTEIKVGSDTTILVGSGTHLDPLNLTGMTQARQRTMYEQTQVPVYDYWYKDGGKIWNAIYVGNYQVENAAHAEYDDIPYIWIPNGYIPGSPDGKPEMYDVEQIIREKDERLSNLGQVIQSGFNQFWQAIGPEMEVGTVNGVVPIKNKVISAGPDSHIEALTPWVPEYQGQAYIQMLDQNAEMITGIGPLLLGMTSAALSNSSKAINAQIAMYIPRIALKRDQLYQGAIHEWWEVSAKMWARKDPDIKHILSNTEGTGINVSLEVRPPEITPRDDMEQMQRAMAGVQNRIISARRAMDWVGVDNPSEEMDAIRAEQTDASINPGPVTQQIQLILAARQAGLSGTQQAAPAAAQVSLKDMALQGMQQGNQQAPPPGGSNSANTPGVQGTADNTPANALAPNGAPASTMESQTMLQGGKLTGRILASQKIGPQG